MRMVQQAPASQEGGGPLTGGEGLPVAEDAHGLPPAPGEAAGACELTDASVSPSARLQGTGGGAWCWEEWRLAGPSLGSVVTWEILQQNLSKVRPPLLPGTHLTKWMSRAVKGRHENVYRGNLVPTQTSVNTIDLVRGDVMRLD